MAEVAWRREAGRFGLEVSVPLATTALVFLPGRESPETVGPGQHRWDVEDPVGKEAPLPPSPTVLDLLGHEAAWLEFSKILTSASAKALDGRPVSDWLGKFADTPLRQLLELPIGLGMRQLPDETRQQLQAVLTRFSG